MGKNEPLERYTARVKLSRVDLQSQISHAWVVFFFFFNFSSSSNYLHYKFSSNKLATKAEQRKILRIGMRARKASSQIKTLPFNNALPSSVGMAKMLQAVLSLELAMIINNDNDNE